VLPIKNQPRPITLLPPFEGGGLAHHLLSPTSEAYGGMGAIVLRTRPKRAWAHAQSIPLPFQGRVYGVHMSRPGALPHPSEDGGTSYLHLRMGGQSPLSRPGQRYALIQARTGYIFS
jgi:hypothetical protein